MKDLPRAAQWYLAALWALAAVFLGVILLEDWAQLGSWILALWLPLFIVADYFEIAFELSDGKTVSMTIAEAPMMFLVPVGGSVAVVVVVVGSLIVDMLRGRAWYRCLFNASARCITYLVMFRAYTWIAAPAAPSFSGPRGLLALVATAGVFYILNTLLVSTVIALATSQPLREVYQNSYRIVNWVHVITFPLGALLAYLWQVNPWLLVPGVVPLIMAHRSFRAIAAWQTESRRSKELAQEAQQLAGKLERLQDTTTAMIASFEPMSLLDTVSARLATLLDAAASWVVLLDSTPRLVAARGVPEAFVWDIAEYEAELQRRAVRQLAAADVARLHHGGAAPWQALVIIPLSLENRVLGGICLASAAPLALAEDDRRVLLAFAAQAALAMERAGLFAELRTKQDELIRSSKLAALGTFSAGIAHEFNNLLAGILGHAELGLMTDDVADKDYALNVAVKTCLRGKSITRGLLTFARRNDQRRELNQIRDAVEETLALVERELAKVNVRVERRLQPVPPTICDHGQIAQVLLNLITNARDAMADQGGGVITIELCQRGDRIELSVADTGVGIAPELIDQIFQPFVTTKGALGGSATPGTGLGLAITHGIVESHGGTIAVRSEVGRGTMMRVSLPIVAEELASNDLMGQSLPSLRILIVDDDEAVAGSLARLLEHAGHTARVADGGEMGLRLYREQTFDMVISDVVMPGMGGATFVARLRALDPRAQILVMTGQSGSVQAELMLRAGAFGLISKPFVVDDLRAAIARGLRVRALAA